MRNFNYAISQKEKLGKKEKKSWEKGFLFILFFIDMRVKNELWNSTKMANNLKFKDSL